MVENLTVHDAEAGPPAAGPAGGQPASPPGAREHQPVTAATPLAAVLSPSRASDFMSCPLRYRFRVIDKLPERPTVEAARGTVVHAVLERLFDLPPGQRTLPAAAALVGPQWEALLAAEPDLAALVADDSGDPDPARLQGFLDTARGLLDSYFRLEDPTRLEPADREAYVECELASGLRLRGYIDRLDVAGDGAVRIVDYKTGRAPREGFEQRALFQMRCYALVLWQLRGVLPTMLQLVYLGSGEVIRYQPDEADLRATERKLDALWTAIARAHATGDWRPSAGPLCDWCDHKVRCPAWGGVPPPLPAVVPAGADTEEAPSARSPVLDL